MNGAGQDYEKLYLEMRDRYEELSSLAGSLAHEIKNPLSVIRLNVDLLCEDLDTDSPRDRRALHKTQVVSRQCERLEGLLRDFIRFAQARTLDLKVGDLNMHIGQVLDLYDAQARKQGVEIVRYLDPDLPAIMLDGEALQAALVNLVKNALEAMPDGGQLIARSRVIRGGVALDIIDNGCGMDDKTAASMFRAFFSTKEGGSGLGLPTTRKIIEAHHARIDVHSEAGRGTQFTLEFPAPQRISLA